MPFTITTGGSFTSTGAGVKILLPSYADYFKTWNMTKLAAANPNVVVNGQWFGSKFGLGQSAAGLGIQTVKTTSMLDSNFGAGLGFTYIATNPVVEPQAPNAITAITAASPAVVTQTNTYSDGDIIQFYRTTGMLQIAGMNFQISSSSGSGYTLLGLPAAGFAAAGTAGFTRRISKYLAVDPQFLYVTAVSKATQAVVTFSVDPSAYYVAGMRMYFSIPYSFGMTELNGINAEILSVNAATYQVTLNLDTTAFTTFAFPASSASPTATLFATASPSGTHTTRDPNTFVEKGYNFQYQSFKTGQFTPYIYLSGGAQSPAGASGDIINWQAFKFEN